MYQNNYKIRKKIDNRFFCSLRPTKFRADLRMLVQSNDATNEIDKNNVNIVIVTDSTRVIVMSKISCLILYGDPLYN